MARYQTFTTVGDDGPWVSKLVLELPEEARTNDVSEASFSVYVERKDRKTGEVAVVGKNMLDPIKLPSRGFVPIRHAFISDEMGNSQPVGTHATVVLSETNLTKRIDGDIMGGMIRDMEFRVTQLAAIPAKTAGDPEVVGLVWDEDAGDICPQLVGWHLDGVGTYDGIEMNYGWYEPNVAMINAIRTTPTLFKPAGQPLPEKLPLVVWLHGAGEGQEPYKTVTGNKLVALGEPDIQRKLGDAAYVLAPSCPTFWMDSGSGGMDNDNQSIYAKAVKELIDEFVASHPIDTSRIYVGGLSNGGFMTCRLVVDSPGFFAAAIACCAPWVGILATDEEFAAMAQTPMWWIQSDDDPLVPPAFHVAAAWPRLLAAGANDVHLTYYDHIEDETGVYRDEDGRPLRYIGHYVWINAYNDNVKTELDGTLVLWDGFPVTLWQWVGKHVRA